MAFVWSNVANDEVWVDEDFGVEVCENCCEELLTEACVFEDGDPFCQVCYDELFGSADASV